MKLLVIGGAGDVGSILRPAFQQHHDLFCYDRTAIPELGDRSIVGDVNDSAALAGAMAGMEAVVYLAMGVRVVNGKKDTNDIDLAFDVNVRGFYRALRASMEAGVRHVIFASTLSIYTAHRHQVVMDESVPPDAWIPYGISKRLGEELCLAAGQKYPEATIIALRLMLPRQDGQTRGYEYRSGGARNTCALMPNDTRRLFLAALACDQPGVHLLQTTGDLEGRQYPNTRATQLLGWKPEGD